MKKIFVFAETNVVHHKLEVIKPVDMDIDDMDEIVREVTAGEFFDDSIVDQLKKIGIESSIKYGEDSMGNWFEYYDEEVEE